MKRVSTPIFVLLSLTLVFAQGQYEPNVVLLQIREPYIVSILDTLIIGGSSQLEAIFQQYGVIGSRKLPHVNSDTDGWYWVKFSEGTSVEEIQSVLGACPDVRQATLNHYGILSDTPYDPLWEFQWSLKKIQVDDAWDITKPDNTILFGSWIMG